MARLMAFRGSTSGKARSSGVIAGAKNFVVCGKKSPFRRDGSAAGRPRCDDEPSSTPFGYIIIRKSRPWNAPYRRRVQLPVGLTFGPQTEPR